MSSNTQQPQIYVGKTPLAYRVHCSCGFTQVWLTWEHAWEKAKLHAEWGHKPCLDGLFE